MTTEKKPHEIAVERMLASLPDDATAITRAMLSEVLSPYLALLDASMNNGTRSDDYADALAGAIGTMMVNFIDRIIPHNRLDNAADATRGILSEVDHLVAQHLANYYKMPETKDNVVPLILPGKLN